MSRVEAGRFAPEAGWEPLAGTGSPMKWAEVDLDAISANVAAVRAHVAAPTAVMAMVKANGYGHGAVPVARAAVAAGAAWLGVATPEEALQLRAADVAATLLNVGWTHPSRRAALISEGVHITVFDEEAVAGVAVAAGIAGRPADIHVKLDTGMGRLGARPEQVRGLVDAIRRAGSALRVRGVFTHFADADGADVEFTEEQHRRFLEGAAAIREVAPEALLHCANSAATLRLPHMHHDIVRPGIALYGYAPPQCGGVLELRPAMTMVACVTQVKTVRAGDSVGYGRTWRAERDTRVATIAAGYADGIQRAQSNRGAVLVHGRRCPLIGRVSMDQAAFDVSDVDGVQPGDEVVLFGRQGDAFLGADEVAARVDTISYEVLCGVTARVPRLLLGG